MACGGIYKIENKVNHKVYIGQTHNFGKRWRDHLNALNGNYHNNKHLQNAWNKYSPMAFTFSIIEECKEDMGKHEIFWIKEYKAINDNYGYNVSIGGNAPMAGRRHTKLSKDKMSKSHMCKKTKRNTSGYVGVNYDKSRNKWLVRVNVCGKPKNVGRFSDIGEAVISYDIACWRLYHDLKLLNRPQEAVRFIRKHKEEI